MSDWLFDYHGSGYGMGFGHSFGPQYLLTDSGQLESAGGMAGSHTLLSGPTSTAGATTASPSSTLVGSSSGLQIDLVWDASVRDAANWAAVEKAFTSAAQIYASTFANHALLNIDVGLGEVNGSALGSGELGESESLGYLMNYSSVTHALGTADAGLVSSGQMASGAVTADTALAGKTFFVTSAEAKVLGLANPTATVTDGYVGLTNSASLYFAANGGAIGSSQYDAVGVAAHELSEVMGRIAMVGANSGYYTPLDLFRYTAAHQPDTTPTTGYFSTNLGSTALNSYNNPSNGGDAGDWASSSANARDAYNAFDNPGVITNVTRNDLLEVASLGYHPAGALTTATA